MLKKIFAFSAFATLSLGSWAGVVNVGSASYSDAFPGKDEAGRNGYISVSPQVSGNAVGRPIPTNDWWSNELVSNHGQSMFNYPLGVRTQDDGLCIINNFIGQAIMQGSGPLEIGLENLNCPTTTISDYSDWTVTYSWGAAMEATVAQASPFVYFTRNSNADVTLKSAGSFSVIDGNILLITSSYNRSSYAVYAPTGATWTVNGSSAKSSLNGKNYFSAVLLPEGDAATIAKDWQKFAFVYPADTQANFTYSPETGTVKTTYEVTTDVKEGSSSDFLMGLLPHHWANADALPGQESYTYATVRGEMKLCATNSFSTTLKFHGVIPTLPAVTDDANGFSQNNLNRLIENVINDNGLQDWTDSYNDGQLINRLIQVGRIAKESGNEELFTRAFNLVKERTEKWLTYEEGDIAFMFYYHQDWTTLLGYPAGHGQDTNINDHHFHWGYLIHGAAFVEQYEPGWKDQWGGMVNLLIRDAASTDRNDSMFPYLRNFSPYAGHSWANGTANIGLGIDQESTSESMQFACSLIHWGELSGAQDIRDLGVYLYVTELSAIEEYWFDIHDRNLAPDFTSATASRVFSNSYDDQNFWGGGIAGSYGIQIYPLHAGSMYLVHDKDYAKKFWNAMSTETGILSNANNDNIWYDTWIRFVSMINPEEGLNLYNNCTRLGNKFGESEAHTYQWVHAMMHLGTPDQTVTASSPLAAVFVKNGYRTYVGQNYASEPVTITFSDGYTLNVPARSLASEVSDEPLPMEPSCTLTANPESGITGETVIFTANVTDNDYTVTNVEIKVNSEPLITTSKGDGVYEAEWTPTSKGTYSIVATISTQEGMTIESDVLIFSVTNGSVIPGFSDTKRVDFTADEASQGSLVAGGYIEFAYNGADVTVTAKFDGEYSGFAGPWLWDYTNGFQEIAMTANGDGTYSYTLSDYEPGTTIRVAAKVAFTGGMGVTPICEYTIPQSVGIDKIDSDENAPVEYYNLQGIRVEQPQNGIYIRRQGSKVSKVIIH